MSECFLPLVSSASNPEHLRAGDLDKFDQSFCQVSESIPSNQKASVELCGNATLDPCSCNTMTCVGLLTTGVQFQRWDLEKPFRLPISSERPRDFQVEPSFLPSISLNASTGEQFTYDLEETEGERIEMADQNLDKATGLPSRNEYVWIQRLQGADASPGPCSIKSHFNLSYNRVIFPSNRQPDPSTEIVSRNKPCSAFADFMDVSDSQPCRTGTMFEKLGSVDELKNEEYLSNLLKTSRESLNDLELEHESIYRANGSEVANFFQEKIETRDKMRVHPHPFSESDHQGLKRRRNYVGIGDRTVDPAPNFVHEREVHTLNTERIFRPRGGKDRHSKVRTSKGLRDRRVRLSVSTAIQFYDIQDRLGYDHPSKAIDWLMTHAKAAIDALQGSHISPPARSSVPESKSSLGFKSPINEEIPTYSATSQITDSSRSGSVPIGTLDGYDELPGSQALACQGFSVTSRTNESSRNSSLQAKEHQTSPNLLRAKEMQFWGNQANNRISISSSNSDGSRDCGVATMALGSARSESRSIARRRARERILEKDPESGYMFGNVFSSKFSPKFCTFVWFFSIV